MALPITVAFYDSAERLPEGCLRIDTLDTAARELYLIDHPTVPRSAVPESEFAAHASETHFRSVWVYFPWRNTAVHIPEEDVYLRLRTARNRNLISESDQAAYRSAVVGIAGLSVGSAALQSIVATGGPKRMKLADPDTIELTNLNRMRAALPDIGANKTLVAARALYELDPYAELSLWSSGVSGQTMDNFITGEPGLTVFVDEMDDIGLKFECREKCKVARVPVVMATDNGDSAILDVERYDTDPDLPVFLGRTATPVEGIRKGDRAQFIELANAIIDPSLFTEGQLRSVREVGTTLPGVPQLATAAAIAGAAVAYAVRTIATGQPMPSGRYVLGCDHMQRVA